MSSLTPKEQKAVYQKRADYMYLTVIGLGAAAVIATIVATVLLANLVVLLVGLVITGLIVVFGALMTLAYEDSPGIGPVLYIE